MAVIIRTDHKTLSSGIILFSVEVDSIVQTLELAPGNRFIFFMDPDDVWVVCHMHDGSGNAPDESGNNLHESGKVLLQKFSELEQSGVPLSDFEIAIKFVNAQKMARTIDLSRHPSFGEAIREAIRGLMTEYGDKPANPLHAKAIDEADEWLSENAQPAGITTWVAKDSTQDIMPSGLVMSPQEMEERIKLLEERIGATTPNQT